MSTWIIAIIGLAVYLLLPKPAEKPPITPALALPFQPATVLPADVAAFQKLLEVKEHLIAKGIPAAEVEKMVADIVPHLSKDAA